MNTASHEDWRRMSYPQSMKLIETGKMSDSKLLPLDPADKRRIKTHDAYISSLAYDKLPKSYHNHLIHTDSSKRDWSKEKWIRIVIIDPGEVNLGFRIEKRCLETHTVTTEVMTRAVLSDSTSSLDEELKPADMLYGRLLTFFQRFIPYFMQTHILIMEKQIPNNTGMTRLGPAIIMYFSALLRDAPLVPLVIEIFPVVKTNVLANETLKKLLGAKKWSIRVSTSLLKARGDTKGLEILQSDPKKMDDMADTIIMPEAFLLLLLFDFHIPFLPTLYKVADMRRMIRKRLYNARLLHAVETAVF